MYMEKEKYLYENMTEYIKKRKYKNKLCKKRV